MIIFLKNIKKIFSNKLWLDLVTLLSECYYYSLDYFFRSDFNKLAEHRLYNYNILLKSGIELSILLLYNYSQDKLYIIKKYLKEYILKE